MSASAFSPALDDLVGPGPQRLAVRWLAVQSLRPYESNPRNLPQSAIDLVATSIAENGFLSPIICDEQLQILAGHTRLAAASPGPFVKVAALRREDQGTGPSDVDKTHMRDAIWRLLDEAGVALGAMG